MRQTISAKPIKVMHIVARLNVGGVANYVITLNAHLNSRTCASQLVCGVVGSNEGDMRYLADQQGVPVTIVPSLGREISPLRDLSTLLTLWKLIRRERPDVVHTHTAKAGLVGRLAARLAGVQVVVHTFHGHVFAGYFSPLKTRFYIWIERFCGLLSTRIITLSAALKRELSEVYHIARPDKFEIVELGFDLRELVALPRHTGSFRFQHDILENAALIGMVGRLVPVKNHDLFLQAAALVQQRVPGIVFAIIGDGELRTAIEAHAVELGINARFTGWITDLPSVYSALDVVVLSSINEGLPVSLIEAMAAGVPVVATAVGGVTDLLEEGKLGAIVPSNDPAAMAEAIVKVINDPATSQTTAAARIVASTHYDIQHSTEKTLALYHRLLESRRHSSK